MNWEKVHLKIEDYVKKRLARKARMKKVFKKIQKDLNTLTPRKCKVCKGLLPKKKHKYCNSKCSRVAERKLTNKRNAKLKTLAKTPTKQK